MPPNDSKKVMQDPLRPPKTPFTPETSTHALYRYI